MAATVRQRHESDRSTGLVGSAHSRLTCQLRVTFLAGGTDVGRTGIPIAHSRFLKGSMWSLRSEEE